MVVGSAAFDYLVFIQPFRLSCKLWFWLHFLSWLRWRKEKWKYQSCRLRWRQIIWKIEDEKKDFEQRTRDSVGSIHLPTIHRFQYFEVSHVSVPKLKSVTLEWNIRLISWLIILWKDLIFNINIARIANLPYGQSQLYLKSAFVVIVNFGQNCEIWPTLWILAKIVKIGRNCEIWPKL